MATRAITAALILATVGLCQTGRAGSYTIVDTGQDHSYDSAGTIIDPTPGQPFYGQDAQVQGSPPAYQDNGNGTVSDRNTGLMWTKTPDFSNKLTWDEAKASVGTVNVGGYSDWRLPTIKELYSLIDFNGSSKMTAAQSTPYIDTNYFDFVYPDPSSGERLIDAQYWSSTGYVGTTMGGDATAFGVNFADGRIKGYPTGINPGGHQKTEYVRYVRGGDNYGVNNFVDNGDGTISDRATGLMWMKADSGTTADWEGALDYAEDLQAAGHDDWRLPNAKELQSIVDYTHAPDATDPAKVGPAIDAIFEITSDDSYFWTSTTHLEGGASDYAVYFAFGEAWGYMERPPGSGNYSLENVHGAGAQRSDPKTGDPGDWPNGNGPQGDVIRIYNYARAVRNVSLPGDLTGDGFVDDSDLSILLANWDTPLPTRSMGDLDGDSVIGDADLSALLGNWNPAPPAAATAIPEPAAAAILGFGGSLAMLRRKRRA